MSGNLDGGRVASYAEALIGLIDLETGLLDEKAPERLIETQEQKKSLIDNYRDGVNLIQSGQLILTQPEKQRLAQAGTMLEDRMVQHARRIARLKSITEGLIHTVAQHAEKDAAPVDGYGASGRRQAASMANNAYRRPTALSVNRMI